MPRPKRTKIGTTSKPRTDVQKTGVAPITQTKDASRIAATVRSELQDARGALGQKATMSQAARRERPSPRAQSSHTRLSTTGRDRRVGAPRHADSGIESATTPRPQQSEAANQEQASQTIDGPLSSVSRSFDGRISGHVKPPHPSASAAIAMGGFEEHLLSSSPRLNPPASALRGQATPSFLSMSGFKRRPRQPSLLQMVEQHDNMETVDGDDDELVDSVLRDLEASSPAEGHMGLPNSSMSRKRKAGEMEPSLRDAIPSSPPQRRRTSSSPGQRSFAEDVQVPATQHEDIHIFEDQDVEPIAQGNESWKRTRRSADRGAASIRSLPHSSPPARIRSSQSSARSVSKEASPPKHTRSRPRPQPAPAIKRNGRIIKPKHAPATQRSPSPAISAPSPISSSSPAPSAKAPTPPVQQVPLSKSKVKITHRRSDGRPRSPTEARPQPAEEAPVTTEALRRLLPRRRIKPAEQVQDPFELYSSSPPSAEASSTPPAHGARKRQPLRAKSANVRVPMPTSAKKAGKAKVPNSTQKGAAAKARPPVALSRRTYGQRAAEVQSNHDDDEDANDYEEGDTTFEEAAKSTEIKRAVQKFAEIDEWEMSFESCDVVGGNSSPWR